MAPSPRPPDLSPLPPARPQGWVERDRAGGSSDEEGGDGDGDGAAGGWGGGGVDDDEDRVYLERADRYEADYNFRYEEPGGAAIVTYPRQVRWAAAARGSG